MRMHRAIKIGQPADVVLSQGIGSRLGLLAGEHKSLAVAKEESRAADMLQVRSTGALLAAHSFAAATWDEPTAKGRC